VAGTAARRGAGGLARALYAIGMAIVAVLVAHIVLTLLQANPQNGLTTLVRDLAARLDLGLSNLFLIDDAQLAVVLNYGAAALAWFLITRVLMRVVQRVG
jgi:hypothetical protein